MNSFCTRCELLNEKIDIEINLAKIYIPQKKLLSLKYQFNVKL